MVEITVCGHAVRRASAERASVTVRSRWSAPSAEAAMRAVAEAHERLVADARAHAATGAAESWHADRIWIAHHREWVGEGQPPRSVYTAEAAVTVRFVDVEALGAWMVAVGVHETHEVGGVEWSLTEETERDLAKAARALAIADAVERAGDYAAAAGLSTPTVAAIQEPGTAAQPAPAGKARREMAALSDTGGAPPVSLAAGELEVRAAVEVRFVAEPQRHAVGTGG
ncbi:SIMPL domain-containing protein [Agrococcus carbonis]|uniref:SIMPL domain-containing protein n=1 Tax=Agrococcus carbonis TaxID=684552 RepID=A0A1H1SLT0_9MICO|nr:SIMPL domain-containing protein [Agrococcus carbonis]SDS48957.1 Protein of unknown function [Agrococcus carbonis]